jgi:hypothetical protein
VTSSDKSVICISSTGSGSRALLMRLPPQAPDILVTTGPRLDPHGEPLPSFSSRLRGLIANLIAPLSDRSTKASVGVISLDGVYGKPERTFITQAMNSGPVPCDEVLFLHRGEACLLAARGNPWQSLGIQIGLSTEVTILSQPGERYPRVAREGGFMPFTTGDGGGYFIGRELLRTIVRPEWVPSDSPDEVEFAKKVRDITGWLDEFDPLRWIWRASYSGGGWSQIADIAQCVVRLGDATPPDPVAATILRDAAALVGESVRRVLSRVPGMPGKLRRVVFSGGLLIQSRLYRTILQDELRAQLPIEVQWEILDTYPLVGCARRAAYHCKMPNREWDELRTRICREDPMRPPAFPSQPIHPDGRT